MGAHASDREFELPGPWWVSLPSDYRADAERNGETICVWLPEVEEFRGKSFWFETAGADYRWSNALADVQQSEASTHSFRLNPATQRAHDESGYIGFAQCWSRDHRNMPHLLIVSLTLKDETPLLDPLAELAQKIRFDSLLSTETRGD